jgi:putative Mn2+ efflux pump MntP
MLSVVLIGLSLSVDAFAVSVSSSISIPGLRPFYAIRASLFFGFFQFFMPLAGWYLGGAFAGYIDAFDHWIAFGLLVLIGGKELVEALRGKQDGTGGEDKGPEAAARHQAGEAARQTKRPADIRNLLTLCNFSVATSIDALAVGVSFNILGQGIWGSAALIGGITFVVCLTGFEFGRRIGRLFKKSAQAAGGLILIGIGVKILLEHLAAIG